MARGKCSLSIYCNVGGPEKLKGVLRANYSLTMAESVPFLHAKSEDDAGGEQCGIPLEDQYHDDSDHPFIHDADIRSHISRAQSRSWSLISGCAQSMVNLRAFLRRPTAHDLKKTLIEATPRIFKPSSLFLKSPPGPTAYLDALRGYAAWNVFLAHGYKDIHYWFNDLPFFSWVMGGEAMVALFFVISGYVLSYSLLIHTHNRSGDKLLWGLASSTFRRGMRLYGSTTVALFAAFIMVRLQLYNGSNWPVYVESFWANLYDWLLTLLYFINPFATEIHGYYTQENMQNKYLGPMWTIPVELRGSMILFIYIAATCKLRAYTRLALTCVFVIFCYIWRALYVADFLMGMIVAEIGLLRNPERLVKSPSLPVHTTVPRTQSLASKCFWTLVALLGIFLLGEPVTGTDFLLIVGDGPWRFLRSWIPSGLHFATTLYWYLGMGGFLLILGLEMYPTLQAPLRCGFSQYVGELSFGIYALHVPLLIAIIGHWYDPNVRLPLGWDRTWGVVPGAIIMHLAVFTTADYFTRVDKRVVRLGRWIQEQLFERWDQF